MKIERFNQIKKMMERTFSEHDPEALTAIRMVNKWLAEEDLTWERVLSRTINVIAEVEEDPEAASRPTASSTKARTTDAAKARDASLLDEAEEAASRKGTRSVDFVASVREQFETKGWISQRQREALESIV